MCNISVMEVLEHSRTLAPGRGDCLCPDRSRIPWRSDL